ncbi:MAG TPA: DNA translocase FtsK [Limnochordales bacterium]
MKSHRWQAELAGLAVVFGVLYAGLALFWGQAGEAGAWIAAALWRNLGLASALALLAILGVGWRLVRWPDLVATVLRLGGAVAAIAGVSAALELVPGLGRWTSTYRPAGAPFIASPGGEAGRWLARWLEQAVGLSGAYLAIALMLLAAAALTFEVSPARLLEAPVRAGASGVRLTLVLAWRAGRWLGRAGWQAAVGLLPKRRGAAQAVAAASEDVDTPETGLPVPVGRTRRRGRRADGEMELMEVADGQAAELTRAPAPALASVPGDAARAAETPVEPQLPPEEPGEEAPLPRASRGRGSGTEEAPAVPLTGGVRGNWRLPPSSLLARPPARRRGGDEQEVANRSRVLEQTLASFGIEARVVSHTRGPVVTRYEMALAPGIKLSRVVSLADDLALALASTGVRIEAPVPGKPVIGIEVPNATVETVYLREVLESPAFARSQAPLALALGKDVAGEPLIGNLERLIHLLIAGATGSGKSVCLASIIMSLLYRLTPDQLRLLLIDPKRVELTVYEGIPHLLAPVVTDVRQAAAALRWAVREMEARYQVLAKAGARNLAAYNQLAAQGRVSEPLPYLVVVIDELADLMLVAAADVEDSICRLAQMARAAGIHLVIATQRPSTDVITGLIKANIPSRLAFAVSSQVDSRTILDTGGAERLLGRGDMLYHPLGEPKPIRAQGCLVTDREIEQVVDFWKSQGEPDYRVDLFEEEEKGAEAEGDVDDALYDEAVKLVVEAGQASVSMLQRRFRIGYARAARLIDLMEQRGVVGPYQGSKPREVLPPYRRRERSA